VSFDPEFLRVSVVKFCLSDQCHPCLSVVSFWFPILNFGNYPILAISAIFPMLPLGLFSISVANKDFVQSNPSMALARRLGGPIPNPVGRGSQAEAGGAKSEFPGRAIQNGEVFPPSRWLLIFKELAHLGAASR
jgi:hypothetical protein